MTNHTLELTIATPLRLLVDKVEIISLRAEDESGSFGIRAGHVDFVTLLAPSVVRWMLPDATMRFCAVDGGVMMVTGGAKISLACREAISGDSLEGLEAQVRRVRAAQEDDQRRARVDAVRLHAHAVREMIRYLRASSISDGPGGAPGQGAAP